jgi:hypothetical protein
VIALVVAVAAAIVYDRAGAHIPAGASPEQLKAMLKGIHVVSEYALMFPPAWIWYIIPALLILGYCACKAYTRTLRYRRRSQALRELHSLSGRPPAEVLATAENILKRAALIKFGPQDVASLYDDSWARFIVGHSKNSSFPKKIAAALAQSPYRPAASAEVKPQAVIAAVTSWIEHNL